MATPQEEFEEKIALMDEKCQIVIDTCRVLREQIHKALYDIEETTKSIKNNI